MAYQLIAHRNDIRRRHTFTTLGAFRLTFLGMRRPPKGGCGADPDCSRRAATKPRRPSSAQRCDAHVPVVSRSSVTLTRQSELLLN
jgi:hypothetical protein